MCFWQNLLNYRKNKKNLCLEFLAYDIETSGREVGAGEIFMVSLFGKDIQKVLTWKKHGKSEDYVELFDSEADMLEKFAEYVREYDADYFNWITFLMDLICLI